MGRSGLLHGSAVARPGHATRRVRLLDPRPRPNAADAAMAPRAPSAERRDMGMAASLRGTYSDVSEAISMEKRYFTSDLARRS